MSNITPQFDLNATRSPDEFFKAAPQVITQVINQINGKLDFSNLNTQEVTVKTGAANTAFDVMHNLNRTGLKFIVASKDVAADVYRGDGDTVNTIVLKCTSPSVNLTLLLY